MHRGGRSEGVVSRCLQGPDADSERYQLVAELLPDAWIEDPEWNTDTQASLHAHLARVTWDAPLHSLADLEQFPVMPRCINMKPSRFGYLSELFRVYEFCEARGIAMYGGGQFELGPGRGQAQYLAGLFHADASNDLAPSLYNESELPAELPLSPLELRVAAAGFRAEAS